MSVALSIALAVLAVVVVLGGYRIGDRSGWSRERTWRVRQAVTAIVVVVIAVVVALTR